MKNKLGEKTDQNKTSEKQSVMLEIGQSVMNFLGVPKKRSSNDGCIASVISRRIFTDQMTRIRTVDQSAPSSFSSSLMTGTPEHIDKKLLGQVGSEQIRCHLLYDGLCATAR